MKKAMFLSNTLCAQQRRLAGWVKIFELKIVLFTTIKIRSILHGPVCLMYNNNLLNLAL